MKQRISGALLACALLLLAGCAQKGADVNIRHIHGLGFNPDGTQLYVAAHDGFVVHSEGKWQVPDLPKHDYMGYSPTDTGFYSSGHPAQGSSLQNPLGLVKSDDGGKTLVKLGFQGEIDFHSMGAGYKNHAVYVFNHAAVPKLAAGLHYTLDEGRTWTKSEMQGVPGEPIQVAVHPSRPGVVALATEAGLYLSTDHGNRFERIGPEAPVAAASFSPGAEQLLFGFRELFAYDLAARALLPLKIPAVGEKDAIGYIAISPAHAQKIVIGTFGRDIHRTIDGGQTWTQIASGGKATGK